MKFGEFMKQKKVWITLLCAGLALIAALIAAFAAAGGAKKAAQTKPSESVPESSAVTVSQEEPPAESLPEEPKVKPLIITSPESLDSTVTDPQLTLSGVSDPAYQVTMNGNAIPRDEAGNFSVDVTLKIGNNTFTFCQNGVNTVCKVKYRYVVINGYSPSGALAYASGSTVPVLVSARTGSDVTATFRGETVRLTVKTNGGDGFSEYAGNFTLPSVSKDTDFGKITFKATQNNVTESFSSGKITCKKTILPTVAEVVIAAGAETFTSTDNKTRPTNNYLPVGTVDYVTGSYSGVYGSYKNNFLSLKCGKWIYSDMPLSTSSKRVTVSKTYEGTLPDHNEISVASVGESGRFTTLALNVNWKAPFFLDLKPQTYTNAAAQDYTLSAFTAEYVEIEFCYATVFEGDITFGAENPVFRSATVTKNANSTTVRLYLKQKGSFFGWDCSYNEKGQLVFKFRHPVAAKADESKAYGADMTGITVLVDAGHGGKDSGATGGSSLIEKVQNLKLAFKVKAELEKTGATVLMTRTGDTTLESPERIAVYRKYDPDLLIVIHHDSNGKPEPNGLGVYYTTPFSMTAAKSVFESEKATGLFAETLWTKLKWHSFYMTRMTYCPAVLTENGFMSNPNDLAHIANEEDNTTKAIGIARGIANYFLSACQK